VRRYFPAATLQKIETAIAHSESRHTGEICFAVEAALSPAALMRAQTARERAVEVFSELRIWDTEHNNGILLYLLLADHDIEIVADRGLNHPANAQRWQEICRQMEQAFQRNEFETGVLDGLEQLTRLLIEQFPNDAGERDNELSNRPVVL
jgi:uncharacterized membrane protein